MPCETPRWTGRPGFVRIRRNVQMDDCREMIPCPGCGGQGIARCCAGACEQPNVEPQYRPVPLRFGLALGHADQPAEKRRSSEWDTD